MQLPKIGDVLLEKYVLEERLGEGGMGVVYAARHSLLGQRVAVKLIRPEIAMEGEAVARFLNEARAAARIHNDHVARVLDVGMLQGRHPYMILEFLDGTDVAQVLREHGPLAVADVADYLLQTIEGLAHAHMLGIVHRDLKPSNLFLARRPDGTAQLKVLDFGIAKATSQLGTPLANMTKKNAMLGSPHYMSPEQLRDAASVDARSDIWALGIVAYELLTGHPPFDGDNAVAVFAAIQESEPRALRAQRRDVDGALENAILKCLGRRPETRFASVTELGIAIAPFGTVVAARALENAKRILPLGNASKAPSDPKLYLPARSEGRGGGGGGGGGDEEEAVVSATLRATPLEHVQARSGDTVDAVASSRAGAPLQQPRSLRLVGGAALFMVGALTVVVAWMGRTPEGDGTVVARVVSAPAPSVLAPPSATPLPIEPVVDAETPAPAPSASARVKPRTVALPDVPDPRRTVRAIPTASAVPPSPASCVPPFTFDSNGIKKWKPECVSSP